MQRSKPPSYIRMDWRIVEFVFCFILVLYPTLLRALFGVHDLPTLPLSNPLYCTHVHRENTLIKVTSLFFFT